MWLALSDLYMLWWDKMFVDRLISLSIIPDLYARFKDDGSIIADNLPPGSMISNDRLVINHEKKIADLKKSPDIINFEIFQQIANSIDQMIQFTFDVPSKNPDNKVAIFDLKVNLDQNGNVVHNFYEKPTKHPQVILANSAISYHQKITIMTQEAIRRMKNTNSGPKCQNVFLSQFMSKLRSSGYDRKFRAEVIRRSKKAFEKIIEKDSSGEVPMYRDRETLEKLKSEKLKRGSWWNRGSVKYSSVVFIPATPGGILAKQMREREDIIGKKFKIKTQNCFERRGKNERFISQKGPLPLTSM